MNQLDIFTPLAEIKPAVPVAQDLESLMRSAVHAVLRLMRDDWLVTVAFSSGKDSSALMIVVANAMLEAKSTGLSPKVLVLHSDTGVESPEVWRLARGELEAIRQFAKAHQLDLQVKVVTPPLAEQFATRVIGGRALPSYADLNSDCTSAWKIEPMEAVREQLRLEYEGTKIVTLTGSRSGESKARASKMMKRSENGGVPVQMQDGNWVMSPLMDWSTDDIWELFGLVEAKQITSYSDLTAVKNLYADAGPTSCAVVNDMISTGKQGKGGCGARFGCFTCVRVASDGSMEALLEKEPDRYGYMAGLSRFRNYIDAIQYDWSRRQWFGRTIAEGYVAIQPDVFNPNELRNLFRMAITLDRREQAAAYALGIRPRFQIVSQEAMVYIDAYWALQGYWPVYTAWRDWLAVYEDGHPGWDVPVIEPFAKTDKPEPRYFHVGSDWDIPSRLGAIWGGLRDPAVELAMESCHESPELRVTMSKGQAREIWVLPEAETFTIDPESLAMFEDFEIRDRIRAQDQDGYLGLSQIASGYRSYLHYGLISTTSRQQLEIDKALRRTSWKAHFGLVGPDVSLDWLNESSLHWEDVPFKVVEAHHKRSPKRLAELLEKQHQRRWDAAQVDLFGYGQMELQAA